MTIRPYQPGDAEALSRLYVRSVRQLGARDYARAQVEVWAGLAPSPQRLHDLLLDGRIRLVAAEAPDIPLAFADLEADGHIHFLYCAPEAAGQGVASALYDELERLARAAGMNRLYSEASEAARRFFLGKGFTVLGRRDFEVAGVAIHNYAVEKRLLTGVADR